MSINKIIRRRQMLILGAVVFGAGALILLPKLFGGGDAPLIRAPADISILRLDDTVSAEDRWLDNAEQRLTEMTRRLDTLDATNARLAGENKKLRDELAAVNDDAKAMVNAYEEIIKELGTLDGSVPTEVAGDSTRDVIPPAVPLGNDFVAPASGGYVDSANPRPAIDGQFATLPVSARQEFTLTRHSTHMGREDDLYISAGAYAQGMIIAGVDATVAVGGQAGIASGIGTAGAKIADYFIQRAEQYQPVISLASGAVLDYRTG